MFLNNLSLINFKNCSGVDLELYSGVNCFLGDNGQGKTNLLDAIHYLSYCKSYFNSIDGQNINFGQPFFVVQGNFKMNEEDVESVYCGVQKGKKKQFKRNRKVYDRLSDHIGLFPAVMITPYDSNLILDGSDQRRRFVDAIIAQFDRVYLENLIGYNKALDQRNALLKQFLEQGSFQQDLLDVWNDVLIDKADLVHARRKDFLDEFIGVFDKVYGQLSSGREKVQLVYRSSLNEYSLEYWLKDSQTRDRMSGYTSYGVHKDDLEFLIEGMPIKKFGSQGQQKSFLIALKLAKFEFVRSKKGINPILLLDDIYDKLDEKRMGYLLSLIAGEKMGQTFITDTSLTRVPEFLSKLGISFKAFKVEDGKVDTLLS